MRTPGTLIGAVTTTGRGAHANATTVSDIEPSRAAVLMFRELRIISLRNPSGATTKVALKKIGRLNAYRNALTPICIFARASNSSRTRTITRCPATIGETLCTET